MSHLHLHSVHLLLHHHHHPLQHSLDSSLTTVQGQWLFLRVGLGAGLGLRCRFDGPAAMQRAGGRMGWG